MGGKTLVNLQCHVQCTLQSENTNVILYSTHFSINSVHFVFYCTTQEAFKGTMSLFYTM